MELKSLMHEVYRFFEVVGVVTILAGFVLGFVRAARPMRARDSSAAYSALRATFGHSILLGLEFLVAADLIRTIAVEPTLENLAVLGALVVIRTFLSWSLEVEIEGRWPWSARRCG